MMVPAAAVKKAYNLAQKRLREQQHRNNNEDGDSEDDQDVDSGRNEESDMLLGEQGQVQGDPPEPDCPLFCIHHPYFSCTAAG